MHQRPGAAAHLRANDFFRETRKLPEVHNGPRLRLLPHRNVKIGAVILDPAVRAGISQYKWNTQRGIVRLEFERQPVQLVLRVKGRLRCDVVPDRSVRRPKRGGRD